ncbi:hypothetical protein [Nitrosospira sp. NpAV]|uniref:hypothetical protein n=1 Tax=Nitrosospira sp. NpAV TaxID=58133 RepID=UPI0012EBBE10|nr:hypothetical protein [Nitrosospira sp. NpAV]
METLKNTSAKLSEAKGENFAMLCLLICFINSLSTDKRENLRNDFEKEIELIRVERLDSNISEYFDIGVENTVAAIRLLLSDDLKASN